MKRRAEQAYKVLTRDRNVYLAVLAYLIIFISPNSIKLYISPVLYECVPFLKKYLFAGIMPMYKIVFVVITASEIYRLAGLIALAMISVLLLAKYLTHTSDKEMEVKLSGKSVCSL